MPMAGKTGTTQNWADAWTTGYSAYYTTSIWLGFDRGGSNSLGTSQTGALTVGPIWAKFMTFLHKDLAPRYFTPPQTGITYVTVTTNAGLLPPTDIKVPTRTEIFKSGTEPKDIDTDILAKMEQGTDRVNKLNGILEKMSSGSDSTKNLSTDLYIPPDLMDSPQTKQQPGTQQQNTYNNLLD